MSSQVAKIHSRYDSGDLVFRDLSGTELLRINSSGLTYLNRYDPWVFRPEAYGAKADGVTDDTAAIKSAVNAAVTYAQNNQGYAEVWFGPHVYLVAGATTTGATKGNAQIPLPLVATTVQKVTLVFRGVSDVTGLMHWQQTVGQKAGAVLKSTLVGTNDATNGEASVIGGPTPNQGYGAATTLFSNMLVVVDGVLVSVPSDPHVCGFDFRGVAEANVRNAACMADAGISTFGNDSNSTQTWQFGLAMPDNNNNDKSTIGSYSAEGLNYGVHTNEHTVADSIHCIHCIAAVEHVGPNIHGDGTTGHRAILNYVSAEACAVGLGAVNASYAARIQVNCLDVENITFFAINDPGNALQGTVYAMDDFNLLPAPGAGTGIRGAANLRVYDLNRAAGIATSPGIPSSTTALTNPFNRDAAVNVTGGTVTVIAVAGTATGLTAGTVIVPTGKTITLTYSVTPSWNWVLL